MSKGTYEIIYFVVVAVPTFLKMNHEPDYRKGVYLVKHS